jgi:glyceraldehyde 3-phosphate dehydrogenase
MKCKVAINGLGRIGRNVVRQILSNDDMVVTHINDLNPSTENLAYLLNYDSTYGRLDEMFYVVDDCLVRGEEKISVSRFDNPDDIDWGVLDVDILIESTGVDAVQDKVGELVRSNILSQAIVTHSSKKVDKTIILGVNDASLEVGVDRFISSSICDANAVAPALSLVNDAFGITSGDVLTLHPWLGYQNVVDGPCRSFAYPGSFEENFSLGRASTESLIPKTTSCMGAVKDVLPGLPEFSSMSYRIPTPIVSSAIININTATQPNSGKEILELFNDRVSCQENKVFAVSDAPLISKDFIGSPYSCILDSRWLDVDERSGKLRMVLWYDNEFAYTSRVIDTIRIMSHGT